MNSDNFSDSQSAKLDFPIDSRLRGNDGRFCQGLHQGSGDSVGCFVLLSARPLTSGLRVKSAMTVSPLDSALKLE